MKIVQQKSENESINQIWKVLPSYCVMEMITELGSPASRGERLGSQWYTLTEVGGRQRVGVDACLVPGCM